MWTVGGYRRVRMECGKGHRAQFIEYRHKHLLIALSPVEVKRAYYHCEECNAGVIPKDRDLDIVDTSFSPGVHRMMGSCHPQILSHTHGQTLSLSLVHRE